MKTVSIEVGLLMTDNQDGGYTIRMFPSYEDAVTEKRRRMDDNGFEDDDIDDCEYECGYLDSETLLINIDDNGNATLAKPVYFHAGQ